jgi:CRP-like cAMP-binding protein
VLLSGDLEVEVEGKIVTRVTREGEIVGEVSTFTGIDRTATVRAVGDVYVIGFNPAEFEGFVSLNPMVATRLLRSLCERYLLARQEAAQLRAELSARG